VATVEAFDDPCREVLHRSREVRVPGGSDEMHVIRHDAVVDELELVTIDRPGNDRDDGVAIERVEAQDLSVGGALRQVVEGAGSQHERLARSHAATVSARTRRVPSAGEN
jgi:hypothetical protein